MAAPRRDTKPSPTGPQAPAEPPYYIATAPLFIGGSQFARAHNPGDRVPAAHVAEHGWQNLVRPPDGYDPAPDNTADEPAAKDGQATTEGKGDA